MTVRNGSRVPLHPMRNRSFTEGLVPSTGEYPVLTVKRSLAWSNTKCPLVTLAIVHHRRPRATPFSLKQPSASEQQFLNRYLPADKAHT